MLTKPWEEAQGMIHSEIGMFTGRGPLCLPYLLILQYLVSDTIPFCEPSEGPRCTKNSHT